MTKNLKATLAAAAAVVALVGGVAGFAIARGTDGDAEARRDAPAHMAGGNGAGANGPGAEAPKGAAPDMAGMTMDDAMFISMMIPHHQAALDMAEVVIRRGSDPEVRAIARRIVDDQRAEIAEMRDLYRTAFGGDPPSMPAGHGMMMGMGMDAATLESAPEPDRAFLGAMIPHHAGAILMADAVLAGDPRPEVADLARRIIAAQAKEIGEMQAMRERIAPPLG